MIRLVGWVLITTPFLFGTLRLITTSCEDSRYLIIAAAAFGATGSVFPRAFAAMRSRVLRAALAALLGAATAVVTALVLGHAPLQLWW